MKLSIIVARAKNGVIGVENDLPWHLPQDLKHFKETTLGCPIIMGRNTWESIGRPLPGRRNIVVSRTRGFSPEGAETFTSLQDAIEACQNTEQAFIIGGAQIYEQAIDLVDQLIVTEVDLEVVGDAHFPEFSSAHWKAIERLEYPANPSLDAPEKATPAFAFVTYQKI